MKKIFISCLWIGIFLLSGCATKEERLIHKKILSPEQVGVCEVEIKDIWPNIIYGRQLLKGFPFISNQPIIDFRGKFSDQFYAKIDYRYKAAPLEDVDFWKLRTNPFLYDFIYVLPTWAYNFKRVSSDLFEDIGYTYNLSSKEQDILKWWIKEGGILWVEGGIYATRYDFFKKDGEIDEAKMVRELRKKCHNLVFWDRKVHSYFYKAKKLDFVNYLPLRLKFHTTSPISYFKDIKYLKIETKNYINVDFLPEGEYLLWSKSHKPLVSFIRYGKGGVLFLRPFEFIDKRFDGELLRWRLLFYLLERKYLSQKATTIEQRFQRGEKVVLHNIRFAYKSAKVKKESYRYLRPIALYLKKHPHTKLLIIGHTDSIGSRAYNKKLSLKRAKAVKAVLVEMGISPKRIFVKGKGESEPIAPNTKPDGSDNPEGRALNRRVEFQIM